MIHTSSKGKEIKIPGPDHPITISPVAGKARVTVAGKTVAESMRALRLEEKGYPPVYYLPRGDADMSTDFALGIPQALPRQARSRNEKVSQATKGDDSVTWCGRVKWNVAPPPLLALAHNRPPCDSTMERLMANPMPLPCALVVKNAEKI